MFSHFSGTFREAARRSRRSRRNQEDQEDTPLIVSLAGCAYATKGERGNPFKGRAEQRAKGRKEGTIYAFEKESRGWGYDKPNSVYLIKSNMFYVDAIRPRYNVLLLLGQRRQKRC